MDHNNDTSKFISKIYTQLGQRTHGFIWTGLNIISFSHNVPHRIFTGETLNPAVCTHSPYPLQAMKLMKTESLLRPQQLGSPTGIGRSAIGAQYNSLTFCSRAATSAGSWTSQSGRLPNEWWTLVWNSQDELRWE